MGADMLVSCFFAPQDKKFKPDWEKGHRLIDKIADGWKGEGDFPGFFQDEDPKPTIPEVRERLHDMLYELKDGVDESRRDVISLDFSCFKMYLSGGMSWGDSPTDIMPVIDDLDELGILEAVGFNHIPNYKGIVDSLLENKELHPLLLKHHDDLDALLKDKLR